MKNKFTIFLDIDGVLSSHMGLVSEWKKYRFRHSRKVTPCFSNMDRWDRLIGSMAMVCPYNIEEFNIFCRYIGFENIDKIVISSTWRLSHKLSDIAKVLYLQGLEHEIAKKIIDRTKSIKVPRYGYDNTVGYTKKQRYLEIDAYINENNLNRDHCIVLDDIPLGDLLGDMYYDLCDYINGFEYDGLKNKWLKDLE